MRSILIVLAIGAVVGSCAELPLPVTSGIPTTCAERLTEASCGESTRCRWVNDSRREDGTFATAHCTTE